MVATRFAVTTFDRVFDAEPKRDVIDLATLTRGLLTFILKPELAKAVARDLDRVDEAWAALEAGKRLGGRRWGRLVRAEQAGGRPGARREYEKLRQQAKARAKTDLRLWSPALFREGGRRESADVLHVSCLVLDYDGGVRPEEASGHWEGHYHVVHTTWSHRPELPKFRLVLPLARPVRADDWRAFWEWGATRVGMRNDPALKSPASTFALPSSPTMDAPRFAYVAPGELLDPFESGLALHVDAPPDPLPAPGPTHFRGDPSERTVEHRQEGMLSAIALATAPPEEADFDLFGGEEPSGQGDDWDFDLFD
ncbi:MAG: hypothetical protein KF901_00345 [Myxococcales bacterium]|nr:hypothetical protein [Myxococcales bacterium]